MRNLTARQVATLRSTLGKSCTNQEFDLFVEYCRQVGLDPIRGQVVPLIFNANNSAKRQMNIIVTIDGQRTIASRLKDYRPDEDEPRYFYNESLKNSTTNPLGIEKCIVNVWKQDRKTNEWYKVNGTAYWDEFAGVRRYSNKTYLEGLWKTKPRVMIAKCAESQALRKGWPDQFANVFVDAEFDQQVIEDKNASEVVEAYSAVKRVDATGGKNRITLLLDEEKGIERIPQGKVADRCLEMIGKMESSEEIERFMEINREGLREFWAHAPSDALALKKEMESMIVEKAGPADEVAANE